MERKNIFFNWKCELIVYEFENVLKPISDSATKVEKIMS